MAQLRLENEKIINHSEDIAQYLAPLGVTLQQWPVGDSPETLALLTQESLDETEKEQLLALLDNYFEQLKESAGYQTRDAIVLHPQIPNLSQLLTKFEQCHTHDDDEVRYIVDGEGVFGFVLPDNTQVELTVSTGDFINVPANTEHWFRLTSQQRIKAIRYFTSTEGWVPVYTGTPIRFTAAIAS